MSFISIEFVAFFCLILVAYYFTPPRRQWIVLLTASYAFYLSASPRYLIILMINTLSAFVFAKIIQREREAEKDRLTSFEGDERKRVKAKSLKKRQRTLALSLSVSLGTLATFKFIFPILPYGATGILFPVGISFYTLGIVGYLVDVYRGRREAEKNIFKLALLTSYFPHVIQGPVLRYSELSKSIFSGRRAEWDNIVSGLLRTLWGVFKKLVIAETLSPAITELSKGGEGRGGAYVLFLLISYAAQIYGDFTGGIDVALGVSEMLGVALPENFDRPFSSTSLGEYWNRWHITLGKWFTDYVFYPLSLCRSIQGLTRLCRKHLGASIGKRLPVYTATLVTWFLTGLWHGARPHFIAWGLVNGAMMLISQELRPLYKRLYSKYPRFDGSLAWTFVRRVRTFLLIGAVRLFDVYGSVGLTFTMLASLFYDFESYQSFLGGGAFELGVSIYEYLLVGVAIAAVCLVSHLNSRSEKKAPLRKRLVSRPTAACICALLLLSVSLLFGAYGIGYDASDFIYGQF